VKRAEITLARNRLASYDRAAGRFPGSTIDDQGWETIRKLLAHIDDSLDAALADAVTALPPGGAIELLGPLGGKWVAAVRGDHWMPGRSAGGDTPALALRALTAKLREVGR
jgi:hypothetical protein